jgi:uncharacterized protein (TIGR02217 family)
MIFIDERINTRYRLGFRGGPQFSTLHKQQRSGRTLSRPLRQYPLHRFVTDYAMLTREEQREILDWLWVAEGSCNRFRFRDWNDWQAEDEPFAVGDGGSEPLQLIKTYTRGVVSKQRNITLPYSVSMTADGAPFTAFAVDPLTGLSTPTGTWPNGAVLRWSGGFDVRVRFQDDYNELVAEARSVTTASIVLVEEYQ